MENLQDIVVFARVVEKGSFTAAGKDLRQSPSAVSKHISRLEEELATKLLNRTTHHVALTEAGSIFYQHCAHIIAELEVARAEATGFTGDVKGLLKVHSSPGVGQALVAPAAVAFAEGHDAVAVELMISEIAPGIMKHGVDLMICSRDFEPHHMVNTGLLAAELGPVPYVVCAAPAYFARCGMPDSPRDLSSHNCLIHTTQKHDAQQWQFADARGQFVVGVKGTFRSNLEHAILTAAAQGLGIARLPEYTAACCLAEGRLQAIFQGCVLSTRQIRAFYPRSKYVPQKVQAFIDFLKSRCAPVPAEP